MTESEAKFFEMWLKKASYDELKDIEDMTIREMDSRYPYEKIFLGTPTKEAT